MNFKVLKGSSGLGINKPVNLVTQRTRSSKPSHHKQLQLIITKIPSGIDLLS